jgi:hypothetical protein
MEQAIDATRLTREFIDKARRLVDEAGFAGPPINPRKLAQMCGVQRIVLSNALGVSGQLLRQGGELVIRLNAKELTERQNFSCCHEIAHTFAFDQSFGALRETGEAQRCSGSSLEERLCDRAAAEMLMPEKFFRPLATGLEPSIESLTRLSKTFTSSIMATILRLGQLEAWPVVFIGWKFTARFESVRKLRVSWSVRPVGSRCFVPLHATADRSSGMYATFTASHPTCDIEVLDLGSLRGKYPVENARLGSCVVSIVHDVSLRRRA